MSKIIDKAKEAIVEYTVFTTLSVIALLFFILWQAVPSAFWIGISESIPKTVLWALIGILVTLLLVLTIYTTQLYFKSKPKLLHFSGVLWDRDHNLYCPKDETPLFQSGRSGNMIGQGVEVFQCPKCDRDFSFNDEDGALIRFNQAQKNFIEKMQVLPGKNFKQLKPPTIEDYFDNNSIQVLNALGSTISSIGLDDLVPKLQLQPAVISHHIDILIHKSFIKKTTRYYPKTGNYCYELTEVGRAYLIKNNLI